MTTKHELSDRLHASFFRGLEPGTRLFDRFCLNQCLEASDRGGVYLCEDEASRGRPVVLKVYQSCKESPETKEAYDSLHLELKMSTLVRHANVLSGEMFHRDDDWTAISMPYIEGMTLRERIEQGDVEIEETVDILLQVALGLSAIHRIGLVHRDIKPENILINANGQVQIADFGVAVDEVTLKRTSGEVLIGTINYLCPEYVRHGYCDRGTDIYALGAIGYELVCGELPWEDTTLFESFFTGTRYRVEAPRSKAPHCPKNLSWLISRALSPSRRRRFRTIEEVIIELRTIKHSLNRKRRLSVSWLLSTTARKRFLFPLGLRLLVREARAFWNFTHRLWEYMRGSSRRVDAAEPSWVQRTR